MKARVLLLKSLMVAVPTPPISPATENPSPSVWTPKLDSASMSTSPAVVVRSAPPMPALTLAAITFLASDPPAPTPRLAASPPAFASSVELSLA